MENYNQLNSVEDVKKMIAEATGAPPELLARLESVAGWLEPDEADLLYRLARIKQNGRIVELGSWQGRSTIALASGLRDSDSSRPPVIAIDNFRGSPENQPGAAAFDDKSIDPETGQVNLLPLFHKNIESFGLTDFVEAIRSDSAEAAASITESVSLLFIDADHSYDSVSKDINAWAPRLTDDVFLVLHDVGEWEGPTRAAADLLGRGFIRVTQNDSALFLIKGPNFSV